jgi:hypothetical protein
MCYPAPMSALIYAVPACIKDQCDQARYKRWLQRKAAAHVKRDRKRRTICTIAQYKADIHEAVCASQGKDFYTGEQLAWSLLSRWDNASARSGRGKYKKSMALLPTIDHSINESGKPKFVICSWYVNDVKSDLTPEEFLKLCKRVLDYQDQRKGRLPRLSHSS